MKQPQILAPEKVIIDFNGNKTASVISDVPKILGTLAYVRGDVFEAVRAERDKLLAADARRRDKMSKLMAEVCQAENNGGAA